MNYLMRFAAIPLAALGLIANAQSADNGSVKVSLSTRADYTVENNESEDGTLSGFHGRYLNLRVDGQINKNFSYSWRQRMNKFVESPNDMFAATDWAYLTYRPNDNWAIEGGKQILLLGGYEYDAAPIDVYFATMFWNNFPCYQFGASASYFTTDGHHMLSAQITNSPYTNTSGKGYAYNLFWSGRMGCFSTLWSANMMEYAKGEYVNYISLGNKINVGAFELTVDLMNRTTSLSNFFDHNFSVVAKAQYAITPKLTAFVKGGYDEFKLDPGSDSYSEGPLVGAGVEFFPIKGSHDVRLHALYDYHTNYGDVNVKEFNVGATWFVDIFKSK